MRWRKARGRVFGFSELAGMIRLDQVRFAPANFEKSNTRPRITLRGIGEKSPEKWISGEAYSSVPIFLSDPISVQKIKLLAINAKTEIGVASIPRAVL